MPESNASFDDIVQTLDNFFFSPSGVMVSGIIFIMMYCYVTFIENQIM